MTATTLRRYRNLTGLLLALCTLAPLSARAATPGQRCESKAATALRTCAKAVAKQTLRCYQQTGAACLGADAKVAAALAKLESKVLAACPDGTTVAAAGYPTLLTPAALVDRLGESCQGMPASLAARSFGGPHAAVRQAASATDKSCLDYAFVQGRKLIDYAMKQQSRCVVKTHAGGSCDPADVTAKIAAREAKSATAVQRRCASLSTLVALDPSQFAARATAQAECAVATAHGADRAALARLWAASRGDRPARSRRPRRWCCRSAPGARAAATAATMRSGSASRRPASPVENVVVFMEGGGACFERTRLRRRLRRRPTSSSRRATRWLVAAIMSSTAATNPFRDWTKVFLPYCTQDLHIGRRRHQRVPGDHRRSATAASTPGPRCRTCATSSGPPPTRPIPAGFRPDHLNVLFSGSSAGGYGAAYNYHWVLDDLRWPTPRPRRTPRSRWTTAPSGVIALGAPRCRRRSAGLEHRCRSCRRTASPRIVARSSSTSRRRRRRA